jgi:hypothetical protein
MFDLEMSSQQTLRIEQVLDRLEDLRRQIKVRSEEIKAQREQLDLIKAQKIAMEQHVQQYLKNKNEDGLIWKGTTYSLETKKKHRPIRDKTERQKAMVEVLRKFGVDDDDCAKALEALKSSTKGEEYSEPVITAQTRRSVTG